VFLPLVDVLRCPNAHDETWLVASIDAARDRDIVDGTLGCPSCLAEYPIRDGVVHFATEVQRAAYRSPSEDDAVRLAAVLDLTDARMTAVLHGEWGAHAPLVVGLSPAQLLLVNAAEGVASGDGVSLVVAATAPLANQSVNAAAFDASASEAMIASLAASVRPGGRLLGPANAAIPAGFTELARDAEIWVAELASADVTSAPIQLGRRRD
jgi:uncharacterized protein YbaR (Trm112 family)